MHGIAQNPSPANSNGDEQAPANTNPDRLQIIDPAASLTKAQISFEILPAEVRRLILFSLASLEDMNALIHASPTYHAQYLIDREVFLRNLLEQTLGHNILIDAYACRESRLRLVLQSRSLPKIEQFLSSYEEWRSTPDTVVAQLNLAELSRIVSFHSTVVRPLVDYFFCTFFANIKVLQEDSATFGPPKKISTTEWTRLVRALYRFQTYCHAFGSAKRPLLGDIDQGREAMLRHAYFIFEPWEVEEISCVDFLIHDKYRQMFGELKWQFKSDNPKLSNHGHYNIPEDIFELGPESK